MKNKLIRISTVPVSLEKLLSGQLRFMGENYEVIAVSSDREKLEKVGKLENCQVFPLEMTRQITPFKDISAVIKLYFFLKRTRPQIVHTHTPKAGTVGMLAAKLAGVPLRLHTVAGLPLLESAGFRRKILNLVERLTYACATKVYPNSFGLLEVIKQQKFCKAAKLKVIANGSSNGIDTAHFNPGLFSQADSKTLKSQLKIDESHFVFLFVGRLVKDKGTNELVAAFEKLQQENPNISLLLVGDFESGLDPLDKQTTASINNNDAIITAGFQNEVRPYFAMADCLVFPSYREGFPNVVLQAGAMELPAIVSDINGCNEIIRDGKNGLVIPVKDENAIYQAMKKMLENPDLAAEFKVNARQTITSKYEQKAVWEALLAEYRTFETK